MAEHTLFDKIWDAHTVDRLSTGQDQIFIGLHLIHEITTAPASTNFPVNSVAESTSHKVRRANRLP